MPKHHKPVLAGALATCSAMVSEHPASLPGARLARTVGDLIDAYMAVYAGRDSARGHRLARWQAHLGGHPLETLTDDEVFHALESIGEELARVYVGRNADGAPMHRAKGKRSPGKLNRYHSSLAAVFS